MPRIAYTAPGATCTAFAPVPAQDGRGFGPFEGKASVSGQPGTQGVPCGLPDFGTAGLQVNGLSVRGAGGGYAQGSGTMPLVWYPQLYYLRRLDGATQTVAGQGASVYSDNQMPVPARDPLGRAAVLAKPPIFLGQADIYQPRAKPKWPTWTKIAQRIGYVGPGNYGG